MKWLSAALVVLALAPQAPATGARLGGIVVEDGVTPARPIRRAIVTVTGSNLATPLQVLTDDQGRFVVAGLTAGRFSLSAEKAGYLKSYYGSTRITRPPGMPVAITDGQTLNSLTIALVRGAVIGGTVREPTGTPVAGAQVQISMIAIKDGRRTQVSPSGGSKLATTDDRGEYRLWGLMPGEYVVRAVGGGAPGASNARVVTDAELAAAQWEAAGGATAGGSPGPASGTPAQTARLVTYFPGTVDPASAQGVVVAAGDERLGIDIVSRYGQVSRVSGTTAGPDGRPVTNMLVGIANVSTNSLHSSPGIVRPNAAGEFAVAGLTPGRWLLYGRGAEPGTSADGKFPWWTYTEFELTDQNLSGLVLQFTSGSTVSGRLVFDGKLPRPDLSKLRLSLTYLPPISGVDAFIPAATPAADGTFVFDGVPPGKYRTTISAAGGWSLHSAIADGRDILDTPLDLVTGGNPSLTMTLTDQPTEISGALTDQLGRPAPEYAVVVFSADPALWNVPRRSSGLVKVASDGRYRVTGLPPGEYFLCVVTDLEPNQLTDPSTLEQLGRAGVRLSLATGEKKTQDLRLGGRAFRPGGKQIKTIPEGQKTRQVLNAGG